MFILSSLDKHLFSNRARWVLITIHLWEHESIHALLHAFCKQVSDFACIFDSFCSIFAFVHCVGVRLLHFFRQKDVELLQSCFKIDFGTFDLQIDCLTTYYYLYISEYKMGATHHSHHLHNAVSVALQ